MTTPYASVVEAVVYFGERLHTTAWDDATAENRTKALKMATRDIDQLAFVNAKVSDTQDNEFPRGDQTEVPQDIKDACCEIALSLLDGVDTVMELDTAQAKTEAFGNVRATYDRTGVSEHVLAMIASPIGWNYLRPYLKEPGNLRISRAS